MPGRLDRDEGVGKDAGTIIPQSDTDVEPLDTDRSGKTIDHSEGVMPDICCDLKPVVETLGNSQTRVPVTHRILPGDKSENSHRHLPVERQNILDTEVSLEG